jgi:hypothetical protein
MFIPQCSAIDKLIVSKLFSTGLVVLLILATIMGGLGQHAMLLSDPTVQLVHFGKVRRRSCES